MLDLWVTLFDGGQTPYSQAGDAQSGTTAVAGLSRDWGSRWWLQTGARTTSHEPRTVKMPRYYEYYQYTSYGVHTWALLTG
jgi:hypothetical protein